MPSPIGHGLAGVCGYLLARSRLADHWRWHLLALAAFVALLPDIDVFPGLLLSGDPRLFHHQASHSVTAALLVGLAAAAVTIRLGGNVTFWSLWAGSVYLSHVILDVFVNDPSPPFGVQLLWPWSEAYFMAPVTPFPRFDYFDPARGMLQTMLSLENVGAMLQEVLLLSPLVMLAWYVAKMRQERLPPARPGTREIERSGQGL